MSTFTQLQARATLLASFGSYADISPAPAWDVLCNSGQRDFFWDTEMVISETTFTTVANQAEYTIPSPYFKSFNLVIYGTTIALTRTTEAEEEALDHLWTMRNAGQPSRWLSPSPNVIRLIDKPSTSGDTVTVRGVRAPADMVAGTDTPPCPEVFHGAIALKAAMLQMEVFAVEAEAARLAAYLNEYNEEIKEAKIYAGMERTPLLRRRMRRVQRGRVWNIGFSPTGA
jgi:hypothetical protein